MIRLIKSIYEAAVARNESEVDQLHAESRIVNEASQLVVDRPDKDGWVRMFGVNDHEKGFIQSNHLEMIKKAREFSRFDPNARAALTTLVNYIMGKGLSITPKTDDPLIWYIWREFWTADRNKMQLKQFELIGRAFRDGEIFIEFFTSTADGDKSGKTSIRFVDPLLVKADTSDPKTADTNGQSIQNGVVTDPEDVENVLYYTVQSRLDANVFRKVPADKMHHIKLNVDSDQKRGETQLMSVMAMIKHYQQWIDNRIILNKMRSAVVLIKKVTGTPTEVAAMANTMPTVRTPAGDTKRQNIRGGAVITASAGVEYEMLSPNLQAGDAKEDGRNIKMNIAAGVNMPEYIFGDASNNNYSSSMTAEAPFVKSIQYWQMFFEYHFAQIYRKVIQSAVDAGMIDAPNDEEFVNKLKTLRPLTEAGTSPDKVPASTGAPQDPAAEDIEHPEQTPEEIAREAKLQELMPNGRMETPCEIFFGCDMNWPEIVHRDIKEQVDSLSIARQNGWIADSTASSAMGYDYPEEVRKQKQTEEEARKSGNPLMATDNPDLSGDSSTMDAEMEDALNSLTPEERDSILKTKDPREVVKIMSRKNAAATAVDTGGTNQ